MLTLRPAGSSALMRCATVCVADVASGLCSSGMARMRVEPGAMPGTASEYSLGRGCTGELGSLPSNRCCMLAMAATLKPPSLNDVAMEV